MVLRVRDEKVLTVGEDDAVDKKFDGFRARDVEEYVNSFIVRERTCARRAIECCFEVTGEVLEIKSKRTSRDVHDCPPSEIYTHGNVRSGAIVNCKQRHLRNISNSN